MASVCNDCLYRQNHGDDKYYKYDTSDDVGHFVSFQVHWCGAMPSWSRGEHEEGRPSYRVTSSLEGSALRQELQNGYGLKRDRLVVHPSTLQTLGHGNTGQVHVTISIGCNLAIYVISALGIRSSPMYESLECFSIR